MSLRAIVYVLTVLLLSSVARVQAAAQDVDGPRVRAVRVPVNLERVKRKLVALPARDDERTLLDLSYYLEVYGRAPRINLLAGFDSHTGPVPFGGPSHADILALWTPEAFSTPAVDLSSLFGWFKR